MGTRPFNPLVGIKRYYTLQIQKVQASVSADWKMYNILVEEEKQLVKRLNSINPTWREVKLS